MSDLIDSILQLPQRKLVVAQSDIYLDTDANNEVFVLMVEESRGSAGGRAAGSGHRRVESIHGFTCTGGVCTRFFESSQQEIVDQFDIPYSAVAMDIRLSDGRPLVVQGIVDSEYVASFRRIISNLK